MPETKVVWPPSLWAAVTPPGPELPALHGAEVADVAVVGAGFTGLSTALHLCRAGADVAVLEAAEPGWGASGRNNGQVIPTLSRPDPEDIVRRHGGCCAPPPPSCSTSRARRASRPRRSRPAGCSPSTAPAA